MPQPGLLERAATANSLLGAWKRVQAKGAAGGGDGVTVADFARSADQHLERLRQDLLEGRYVPHPLQRVLIPKDSHPGESRTLHLPAVRDKVAQGAVRAVLEPILDRELLDCSYGYRPGRGAHRAIGRVTHYLRNMKRRWAVVADIDDFFGSLDQARLMDRLRSVISDEGVLRLIELWLRMGTVDRRGGWHDVRSGVGQGGVVSPLLANFYLHDMDRDLVGRGFGLVRYADDFVVLCASRSEAEDALARTRELLASTLRLRLNENSKPIATIEEGFAFLGIRFREDGRSIDPAKLTHISARIGRIARLDDPVRALRDLNDAARGWRHYYGRLLEPTDLSGLSMMVTEGLSQVAARAFRSGRWRTRAEAAAALEGFEAILPMTGAQRRALVDNLVQEAHEQARTQGPAHTVTASPGARPRPTEPARAGARDTVEGAIRRVRRRHTRQLAQVSELVLNTPGTFLGKVSQRIVVRLERRNVCEVPVTGLTAVTLAAHGIALSSDAVTQCAERDVPLLFLSPTGKVVAVLTAPDSPRAQVGLLQLQAVADGPRAFDLARRFALGKIRNQLNLMKYVHKYRKRTDTTVRDVFPRYTAAVAERLRELGTLQPGPDPEGWRSRILSCEGRAAQEYWSLFALLVRDRAAFPGREHRGAADLVNSLLNYGYAVLQARVYLAVLRAGLNPLLSFLHAPSRTGDPSLAFDAMEEFRAPVVDRTVLALLGRREPVAVDQDGRLTEDTRRRLIAQVHDRLATLASFRRQEVKLDEIIHAQARLLVRHLQGEARYRPFVARW